MWNEPDFRLEQLDPRSQVCVMVDVSRGESCFSSGEGVRQNWESSSIQRVHQLNTPASAGIEPWHRCLCPNGSTIFIKFLSPEFQLLDDSDQTPLEVDNTTMPDPKTTTKKSPPPRKAKPAGTKPVAASKSAKVKVQKAPKTPGNYAWLQHRLNAQAVEALSTGDNRSTIREGLKGASNFEGVVQFLERAQAVGPSTIDSKLMGFLNLFFGATINRPTKS